MTVKPAADDEDDTSLIRAAQSGQERAFAILIERHYDRIYRLAFRYCRNQSDAEDIAQNVALKLAGSLGSFRFQAAFSSWLYRFVLNCCHDWARSRRWVQYTQTLDEEGSGALASPHSAEETRFAAELWSALAKLTPKLYETAFLVYGEGLSHKEAAQLLDCAETTISWRLFQIRRHLAPLIGEKENDERKEDQKALAKS